MVKPIVKRRDTFRRRILRFKMQAFAAFIRVASGFNSLRNRTRAFFHWQYSGGLILTLWALVPAMVSLSDFQFAYAFAGFAVFFTLGFITTAEQIKGTGLRVVGIAGTMLFFACACWYINSKETHLILSSKTGELFPGTMETPPNHCGPDEPGSITFILGTMAARTSIFPSTIITVHGKPLLSVDRSSDGRMVFSADIFDAEDNIVAEIDKGEYDVDSSVFKMKRSSPSNLAVVIRKNKEEVLNIDYLNSRSVSITGVFRSHYTTVEVSKDGVKQDGSYLGTLPFCALYNQGKVQTLFAFGG
jgi:hypothetical protein